MLERLQELPLRSKNTSTQSMRVVGARMLLDWLTTFPGATWQQRWLASPMPLNQRGWVDVVREWGNGIDRKPTAASLQAGMLILMCADVVRPDLSWLGTSQSRFLRPAFEAIRDPEGFARLERDVPSVVRTTRDGSRALKVMAEIMAAYGGSTQDITVGDLLACLNSGSRHAVRPTHYAYTWLRQQGHFPPDSPNTLFLIKNRSRQVGPGELVDRYRLRCKPVRDLIVDYLAERQPSLDYSSLRQLSTTLAKSFWADLEQHHPGIDSLLLDPEVSDAWKKRIATKTVRKKNSDGSIQETVKPRVGAPGIKLTVRAFYLDIAQWAVDEPERWAPWVARCPISEAECSAKNHEARQKAQKDQRTRERLPVLPILVQAADRRLKEAKSRLDALRQAQAGSTFIVLGETFTVPRSTTRSDGRSGWAYDKAGRRRDLSGEEKRAFWAWATIEILRHTGIRIEELRELSHHSIIQYKLPTTGKLVPLLQIAPSKTEKERLLLVSPELADVLSAVIWRIRSQDGRVQEVSSFDPHERVWNPPMPLLYQWNVSGENRPISENTLRRALNDTLAETGLTDASGEPLNFQPHDFRRIFITDAILNGLPPHIAQVIAGHENIRTTMSYAAIYPADVIEAHRAFIARRRSLRPTEEYRAVTPEEWQEFLGHFERRKLSLGDCGRAYGTDCAHEHACVRCPVLIVNFDEKARLVEIRENLEARIAEAEREGWLGDVEGLTTSLTAAKEKIGQIEARQKRKDSPVLLGIPSFDRIAGRADIAAVPQSE
ncbi:site-specific integrase [Streptomyces sp. NPDC048680]|uniref:tyrosine-type recombinase/integrase n=1 Tax=Streptomyces sp. NPDC048680 TaxID=3155492 RepID=UPI0034355B44